MPINEDCIKAEQALDMAVGDLKALHSSLCKDGTPAANIAAELLRRDMRAIAEASSLIKQTLSDVRKAFPSPSTQEDAPPLESKLFPRKSGGDIGHRAAAGASFPIAFGKNAMPQFHVNLPVTPRASKFDQTLGLVVEEASQVDTLEARLQDLRFVEEAAWLGAFITAEFAKPDGLGCISRTKSITFTVEARDEADRVGNPQVKVRITDAELADEHDQLDALACEAFNETVEDCISLALLGDLPLIEFKCRRDAIEAPLHNEHAIDGLEAFKRLFPDIPLPNL